MLDVVPLAREPGRVDSWAAADVRDLRGRVGQVLGQEVVDTLLLKAPFQGRREPIGLGVTVGVVVVDRTDDVRGFYFVSGTCWSFR